MGMEKLKGYSKMFGSLKMKILKTDCTLELEENTEDESLLGFDSVKSVAFHCDIGDLWKVYRIKDQDFFSCGFTENFFLEF